MNAYGVSAIEDACLDEEELSDELKVRPVPSIDLRGVFQIDVKDWIRAFQMSQNNIISCKYTQATETTSLLNDMRSLINRFLKLSEHAFVPRDASKLRICSPSF